MSPAGERSKAFLDAELKKLIFSGASAWDWGWRLAELSPAPLLATAGTMLQATADMPPDSSPKGPLLEYYLHASSMFEKCLLHFFAVHNIGAAPCIEVLGDQVPIVDFVTARAITRMLFENVVVFRYIFLHKSDDERIFWHRTWLIGGYLKRASFATRITSADSSKTFAQSHPEAFQANEEGLETQLNILRATTSFRGLPTSLGDAALEGKWQNIQIPPALNKRQEPCLKFRPWGELARLVNLKESDETSYKHGCSFIHTDPVGIWQIRDSSPEDRLGLYRSSFVEALKYFAHAIETYALIWPELRTLPQFESAEPYIERWRDLGRGHPLPP